MVPTQELRMGPSDILRCWRRWTCYRRPPNMWKITSCHNVDNVHNNASDHGKPKVMPAQVWDINDLKSIYLQQFDKFGNFAGTAKLHLKEDAEPFTDAQRKCNVHIKEKLKRELDSMVSQKLIRKVDEHTNWCSSQTVRRTDPSACVWIQRD